MSKTPGTFTGFPRQVRYTPVPAPLFGPLLAEIDDLGEFKLTLRVIWLLHEKRGFPRFVTLKELLADRTLVEALSAEGVGRAAGKAVARGTLTSVEIKGEEGGETAYALNRDEDRKALQRLALRPSGPNVSSQAPWEGAAERSNVFALYEDNIGMLNPMIADELREAEELYPVEWIEDAFREAVGGNKRSWRYIARILERWEREGRGNGEPGRHPKKAGYY